MPVNHYFQGGKGIGNAAEKRLYEDIIVESLKITDTIVITYHVH